LQLTQRDQKAQNAAKTGARTMAKITLLLKGGSRSFLLLDFCGKLKYRLGNKDYYWNQNLTSASLQ
jgi:hypothetical protein